MSERLDTMRRIARVRTQMSQVADFRLVASERRVAEAEADRAALDAFLNANEPLGPLATLALDQVHRLARRQQGFGRARDEAADAAGAAKRRAKQADRMVEDLARSERDAAERRELERLIDLLGATPES